MEILFVVDNPSRWSLDVPRVRVISSRQYLTDPEFSERRGARVFNLCRSYAYQANGYYVSLLAEARGHRPQPDIVTIQDMKSAQLVRVVAEDLDDLINTTLRRVKGKQFALSIYFGRTTAKRDAQLGRRLFDLFRSPLLRAQFQRKKDAWTLQSIRPIPASEIPESHRPIVIEAAQDFFSRRMTAGRGAKPRRYDLAILIDAQDRTAPSDEPALRKIVRAAERYNLGATLITRDDYSRLPEFDALFIRTTTAVNHYTYRFARRAESEGLAVIDDPLSIVRCSNKVYLNERLALCGVRVPKTITVHRESIDEALSDIGLPCVLKMPDSSFSLGVTKVSDDAAYRAAVESMLSRSELVIAQEFVPTDFDWRVGVLDGRALFVAKYFMSRGHWQIIRHEGDGQMKEGEVEAIAVEDAPSRIVRTAVRAARLVGNGLYGVDVKQVRGRVYVMEVNDNPNIDAGYEDRILKNGLYDRIIESFIARIERIRHGAPANGRRPATAAL